MLPRSAVDEVLRRGGLVGRLGAIEDEQRRAEQPEHRSVHELCPISADGKRKRCCLGKVGLA